jgi:bifunctional UDP-N-acetylglucosamine pyrophosphorylase / glucosamine-1-phosphate N-acetyltransferase
MTSLNNISIILAAGKGTRMKSSLPKVLHPVYGSPMIHHVFKLASKTSTSSFLKETGSSYPNIVIIVGHQAELVKDSLKNLIDADLENKVEFIEQKELLGTGHAILQCQSVLKNYKGSVLILSGDTPFLSNNTINDLLDEFRKNIGVGVAFLTAEVPDPTGLGRIIRCSKTGQIIKIVEEKDATPDEKLIKEVNTGTYVFDAEELFNILPKLTKNNKQGEYYLTDVIHLTKKPVIGVLAKNYKETFGINTPEQLKESEDFFEKSFEHHI